MPSDMPKFTLRIDQNTLDKLRYISDNNFRTMNKELEMLVRNHIAAYEEQNGPIVLFNDPDRQETLAAHREDNPMDDMPQDALDSVVKFKKAMRKKYGDQGKGE